MKILIFIILFIIILLCVKIKVGVQIDNGVINLLVWKFKIPIREKDKKQEDKTSTPDEASEKSPKPKKKRDKKPRNKNYFNNIEDFKELAVAFKNTISISNLSFELIIAGDDAASVAKLYGTVCSLVGTLLPVLESNFKIYKKKIYIDVDFEKTKLGYKVYLLIETRIIKSLFVLIKKYKNIKNIIMED